MLRDNTDIKNVFKGSLVIFIYLFASIIISDILLAILNISYNDMSNILKIIYNVLIDLIILVIITYIYRDNFFKHLKDFIKNFKNYIEKYFKYWLLALLLMIISSYIIQIFEVSTTPENQQAINDILNNTPIYAIIITIFIAPITEELVFRESFRRIFAHSNILFIIFSGLIFGLMHVLGSTNLSDLLYIIPYSIPGFVFAYTYVKSKNVFVPISLHFIHNSIMMILSILTMFK